MTSHTTLVYGKIDHEVYVGPVFFSNRSIPFVYLFMLFLLCNKRGGPNRQIVFKLSSKFQGLITFEPPPSPLLPNAGHNEFKR